MPLERDPGLEHLEVQPQGMGFYITKKSKHWYGARIPYVIADSVRDIDKLRAAIDLWETRTVARFVKRNGEKSYIEFTQAEQDISTSAIGKKTGKLTITLGRNFSERTAIHEIGHAIGLLHEHQRWDRNDHVQVHRNNVLPGRYNVDFKTRYTRAEAATIGDYDMKSRMHYSTYTMADYRRFTWSKQWTTIEPYRIGNRTFIHFRMKSARTTSSDNERVYEVKSDGTIGALRDEGVYIQGMTHAKAFQVGSKRFIFSLNASNGRAHIRKVNSNGTHGAFTYNEDWTNHWTVAEPFRQGNKTYLLLIKKQGVGSDGNNVHIRELTSAGKVGRMAYTTKWSEGWTHARLYDTSSGTRLIVYKAKGKAGDGRNFHVYAVNQGVIGKKVYAALITSDWRTFEVFERNHQFYLLRIRDKPTPKLKVRLIIDELGANGLGKTVEQRKWGPGWTHARAYDTSNGSFILFYKRGTGAARIHQIRHNGRLGREHFKGKTLTTKSGGNVDTSDTLTDGDVRAAHRCLYGNMHIGRIAKSGNFEVRTETREWTKGWTDAETYTFGKKTYVFLLKKKGTASDGHNAKVYRLTEDGQLGEQTSGFKWSEGWTSANVAQVGTKRFLILLKKTGKGKDGRNMHIHRLLANGKFGERTDRQIWQSGWTHAISIYVGSTTYVLFYKQATGRYSIRRLHSDGKLGHRHAHGTWTPGWTSFESYQAGGKTYILMLKKSGTSNAGFRAHIYRVKSDGTFSARVAGYRWSEGWSIARSYQSNGKLFLFLLKSDSGEMCIQRLLSTGKVGAEVTRQDWTSGWTSAEFFPGGDKSFIFLLKASKR